MGSCPRGSYVLHFEFVTNVSGNVGAEAWAVPSDISSSCISFAS